MHEATDDGRGMLWPPYTSKLAQRRDVDRAQLRQRCVESTRGRAQDSWDVCRDPLLALRTNRRELLRRQRLAAGVREEAIDDAGNVSHVKSRRRDACRPGVPLLLGQRRDDLADALANLKKNVRDWLEDGGDAVDGTALPPLGARHGA